MTTAKLEQMKHGHLGLFFFFFVQLFSLTAVFRRVVVESVGKSWHALALSHRDVHVRPADEGQGSEPWSPASLARRYTAPRFLALAGD